jgi:hypothetical protein
MGKIICTCKKCKTDNWVKSKIRNRDIPIAEDLECGNCGAKFIRNNREWGYISSKQIKKQEN